MVDYLDASDALARELDLLEAVSRDPAQRYLWFWESPRSLVAPMNFRTKPKFEEAVQSLQTAGWPVNLRSTGGDLTPQGPGILNVTHVYAIPRGQQVDLKAEYDKLCSPIEKALGANASRGWQPGAFCDGAYNVQWNGLKFAGTAMRIRRCKTAERQHAVLAHAIMLTEPVSAGAIDAINRFLMLLGEQRQIDIETHTHLPDDLARDLFVQRLADAFQVQVTAS